MIAIPDVAQFVREAHLASPEGGATNAALRRILKVEHDVVQATSRLSNQYAFRTEFSGDAYGRAVKTAAQALSGKPGMAALKISLKGFDSHSNQQGRQAGPLKEFAEGMMALLEPFRARHDRPGAPAEISS